MLKRSFKIEAFVTLLICIQLHPGGAEGRGPSGGGFRGGAGTSRGPTAPGGAATPGHGSTAPDGVSHSVGIHGGPSVGQGGASAMPHVGMPQGAMPHGGAPGGAHEAHFASMMHSAGPHWNGYHQAYLGGRPIHLAYAGYHPSYYYHPWYHGPWRGYGWGWGWGFGPGITFGIGGAGWGLSVGNGWGYGPYGPYGYWGYPVGWGFGGWGLGGLVYSSGYYPYYNPYYAPIVYQTVVYDYSRPIPVATRAPVGQSANLNPTAAMDPSFDAARQEFSRGEFNEALRDVDLAIARNPSDAVYHEFRALVLFAKRDYRQSAATLHSLLAIGPGWDWTTMSSLYPDPFIYTEQLRELEQYVRTTPQAADAHFVLAYHYMICGHKESSIAQLQRVIALMPNDRLASELLMMVKGPPQTPSVDSNAAPTQDSFASQFPNTLPPPPPSSAPLAAGAASSPEPIEKGRLPGVWQATRPDGSRFSLTLTNDGRFRWKFSVPNQKGDEFGGSYSVDGGMLVLERTEGGALAGAVTFADDGHMNFKLVGAPPDDQGLSFAK